MDNHVNIETVWGHLKPQVEEFFSELRFKGYADEELADMLTDPMYWVMLNPYKKEVFNFEAANFTLLGLCNIVEMLTGSDTFFIEELRQKMLSLLPGIQNERIDEPCLINLPLSDASPAIQNYVIRRLA